MAHNMAPPGETIESRIARGKECVKRGEDHLNLGNFSMHLAVGDEGVQELVSAITATCSEAMTTTKLTLYGNHIGVIGASAIADCIREAPSLRAINLQTNALTPLGVKILAEALECENCGITKVCLGWQDGGIGDEGAIAIAKALRKNKTVTTMNLPNNCISLQGVAHLAEAMRVNHVVTRLDLEDNDLVTPAIKDALQKACLINQKRIKVQWSPGVHMKFPKGFRSQVFAFMMLRSSPVAAPYFAILPGDLIGVLFQATYEFYWHQGAKDEALRDVCDLIETSADEGGKEGPDREEESKKEGSKGKRKRKTTRAVTTKAQTQTQTGRVTRSSTLKQLKVKQPGDL